MFKLQLILLPQPVHHGLSTTAQGKPPHRLMVCLLLLLFHTFCLFAQPNPNNRNDAPLNGVSTYDLLLISKHILNVQPIQNPYTLIAADANKSGNITTFDIVELRKLILGIYGTLPANTSWRFVDADYVFPNPSNPFSAAFPEDKTLTNVQYTATNQANFIGIKIGDINGNANASNRGNQGLLPLQFATPAAKNGDIVTIPVLYNGAEALEAYQVALRFDPARLSFIAASPGDVLPYPPGQIALDRLPEGILKTCWFREVGDPLTSGMVLFNLTFRVLSEVPERGSPLLQTDDTVLENLAWPSDGTEYRLEGSPTAAEYREPALPHSGQIAVTCSPNPAAGEAVTFVIQNPTQATARLSVYNGYGERVLFREVPLDASGHATLALPEMGELPAGVYLWDVRTKQGRQKGRLVLTGKP